MSINVIIYISVANRGTKRGHSSLESDGSEDETLNEKFRQGKNLDELGVDWGNNSENSVDQPDDSEWDNKSENSVDPTDEVDDSEWKTLGAALEKEFLEK